MKALKRFFLLLLCFMSVTTCERDDICAESTPTTPQLRLGFYDFADPENFKNVSRLTAYGENLVLDENGNPTAPVEASQATIVFNANTTELALPLIIGPEGEFTTSRFILEQQTNFRLDDNDNTQSNVDIIEVRYETRFVYVSRACGFKSIFTNLSVSRIEDPDNWILNIEIDDTINGIVENENIIHVQIFH